MPLSTALYTGVSGLNANGSGLSVIGNDISNSNTVGFKGGVASFSDILSGSMSGGSSIGRGVQLQSVLTDMSQGTLQTTSNPLDMAIQGDGFFIVHTAATGGAQFYTRAGQFSLNADGNIVDPNGNFLQGYLLQQGGVLGTINVSSLNSPPEPTGWSTGANTGVQITANLNSATQVDSSTGAFLADPTSNQTFNVGSSNGDIEINGTKVTIPPGAYTGPALAKTIENILTGSDGQLAAADASATATVTYNPPGGVNNPYTFTVDNPAAYTVDQYNDSITFDDGATPYTVTIGAGAPYASVAAFTTALNTALSGVDGGNVTAAQAGGVITLSNASANAVTIDWNNCTATPQMFGLGGTVVAGTTTIPAEVMGVPGTQAGVAIGGLTPHALSLDWANPNTTASNLLGFYQDNHTGGARAADDVTVGTTTTSDYQVAGFDPGNATNTSDFSTSLTIYDSLGNNHLVNVYFKKVAQNTSLPTDPTPGTIGNRWLWWAVVPASDSITGQPQVGGEGELEFDAGGKLVDDNGGKSAYSSFNFTGGVTQNQSIPFNFGSAIVDGGSGLTGTTQFGSPNSILFQAQDGYTSGSLQSLSIDQSGMMSGTFTNGKTENVAQVALARFIAASQLSDIGSNMFSESSTSGGPIIGTAGTSGRGKIFSSSLEASNVDLAGEFVNMITVQRGYEANAKVITVTSQLLQTLGQIISA